MDDTQALHFIGEPLCVGHADTGECEDRLVGETEGLGRGKVPAMTALVDEIGRGLHRILPSIITVIIAPELAQRRQFTQNGDGQLEQAAHPDGIVPRSEEHTSELQSLMRISYAVFCLKKKKNKKQDLN